MARYKDCHATTRNKLFHQYCSSMYGSQVWLLNSNSVEKILSRWRKFHRVVLGVPNTTHCDLLPLIAENIPLECSLELKFMSFYKSIATSENKIIHYMAKNMLHSYNSTMCKNIRHLTFKYDISIDNIINSSKGKIRKLVRDKWISGINESYPIHANVIRDMLGIKEEWYTRILSNDECKFIIDFLCTL